MDRLALVTDTCSHQAGLLVLIACFKDRELTHIQSIYSLLGLRIPCQSRRQPGVPLSPPSEIFLPTNGSARYAYQNHNYFILLRNTRSWQAITPIIIPEEPLRIGNVKNTAGPCLWEGKIFVGREGREKIISYSHAALLAFSTLASSEVMISRSLATTRKRIISSSPSSKRTSNP